MEVVNIFYVIVGLLSAFCNLSSGASRASFGENCSKTERCDSRNFLSCSIISVCECLMPDSMIYDTIAGKCVTLAAERCMFTTVEGESNLLVQLPCISNGTCSGGVCECLSSHFELSNGTCSEKRGFGGLCTSDGMCIATEHLSCGPDKTCICDTSRGLVLEENKCKLLAGSICDQNQGAACIQGSSCNTTTSKCECNSNRFQSVNASCVRKRFKGDSCSSNTECFDILLETPTYLICEEGKCACDSTVAVDDNSGFCRKQLGKTCPFNDCIVGAHCTHGICQCVTSTHFQTDNRTCEQRRTHGESCTRDGQCRSPLNCGTSNKCSCGAGKAFSIISNKCVPGAGSSCEEPHGGHTLECITNANCEERGGWHSTYTCKCQSNFKASRNQDGFCYATQGNTCNGDNLGPFSSKQCLPGLVCRDGVCNCLYRDDQTYETVSESCKSLIGGPCDTNSDCSDAGAECSAEDDLRGCKCKEEYSQVGRECRVSFGGKCDVSKTSGSGTCDKIAGLECTSKGVCECPALYEYNKEEMSCKALIGAKCSVNNIMGNQFCGPTSFCKPLRGSNDEFGRCTCFDNYKSGSDRRCVEKNPRPTATPTTTRPEHI